jgi:hypothetical protein
MLAPVIRAAEAARFTVPAVRGATLDWRHTMMTRTILGLGALLVLSLTLFTLNGRPAAVSAMSVSSFSGVTEGDLTSLFSGQATYRLEALGFMASAPELETRRIRATGRFTATRS